MKSNTGKLSTDTIAPGVLSRQLREENGAHLPLRRKILGLTAAGSMALIALYQTGLIRHLPEPPLPGLDADKVDASDEAYAWLSTPDGVLGLASYAATAVLAAMGGADRAHRRPWIPLAMTAKIAADALQAARLTKDQWTKHEALCFWCLLAAGATFAALPLAAREAKPALETLVSTRRSR